MVDILRSLTVAARTLRRAASPDAPNSPQCLAVIPSARTCGPVHARRQSLRMCRCVPGPRWLANHPDTRDRDLYSCDFAGLAIAFWPLPADYWRVPAGWPRRRPARLHTVVAWPAHAP